MLKTLILEVTLRVTSREKREVIYLFSGYILCIFQKKNSCVAVTDKVFRKYYVVECVRNYINT